MPEPLLVVDGLKRSFGERQAVKGVSFVVHEGETYGLLGPNGAGKTTTISMVAGLLRPGGGSVTLAGRPVTTSSTAGRAQIGLVPQDLAIYPDLTARENLRFFGRLYDFRGRQLDARVAELLELVGLSERARSQVKEFSGGMKRRLNIAIGMLHRPRLLILDEPTVGVDPQSRNAILENVENLANGGMAVLYTTHYMEEAERLCDRVGIIDDGQLKAEGTQRELVESMGGEDVIEVEASGDLRAAATAVKALPGVTQVDALEEGLRVTTAHAASGILSALVHALDSAGAGLTRVEVREPDLEAVFLRLTGKALRD